jgi:hypothetical protein
MGDPVPRFAFYLQGTWDTNISPNPHSGGRVVIDLFTIRIEKFVPRENFDGPLNRIPFYNFPKDSELYGFSESNRLVIRNIGRTDYISYSFDRQTPNLLRLYFYSGVSEIFYKDAP